MKMKNEITEISGIRIATGLPVFERTFQFVHQAEDPYLFKVDEISVKVSFAQTELSIQDCLLNIVQESCS